MLVRIASNDTPGGGFPFTRLVECATIQMLPGKIFLKAIPLQMELKTTAE
jgi:hypothetical protein